MKNTIETNQHFASLCGPQQIASRDEIPRRDRGPSDGAITEKMSGRFNLVSGRPEVKCD